MIVRGFVDIQVNGYMGKDFSSPGLALDDVLTVTEELNARGTIAYCPTVVTGPMEMYRRNLGVLAEAMGSSDLSPHLLGIHVEGPFISAEQGAVGAHQVQFVREPSVEDFRRMLDWAGGNIRMLTLAPERAGAQKLIEYAASLGVVVLLGHHLGDELDIRRAVSSGATCCTHLGNGIPNVIHRHDNPIWSQMACDHLWACFITDGHHLPSSFIKVALRAKGVDRFIVTSDASPIAGLPAGSYECFGKTFELESSGRIFSRETGGLGGSGSTMLECMNFLASLKLLSEEDLWKVGRDNPLRLLGLSPDRLANASRADVVFDGERFSLDGAK